MSHSHFIDSKESTASQDHSTEASYSLQWSFRGTYPANKEIFDDGESKLSFDNCFDGISIDTSESSLSTRVVKVNARYKNEQPKDVNATEKCKESRKFGLIALMSITFSTIVGAGVLTTPQNVYKLTGNVAISLIIWVSYGGIALLGAVCYIELGTTFLVGGGDYVYLHEAFGSLLAFLYQWAATMVFIPAANSVMALVAADYLIAPYVDGSTCSTVYWSKRMFAICFICFLSYANCASSKVISKFATLFTIFKLLVLGFVISCGIYYISINGIFMNENFEVRSFPDSITLGNEYDVASIIRAIFQVGYTFNGFNHLTFLTHDIINPKRNLPLAICITMPLIVALYVFMNFLYFVTLDKQTIIETKAIADDMFKAVMTQENWPYTKWVVPTFIAMSILATLSVKILASSRVNFVGAKNHHCPAFLGLVDPRYSSPNVSIITQAIMSIIWAVFGSIPVNIGLAIYTEGTFTLGAIYAMIYLRIRQPAIPRPIKLPLLVPITYATTMTCLYLSVFCTSDSATLFKQLSIMGGVIGVVTTGVPVYVSCVKKGPRFDCLRKLHEQITKLIQKILCVVPDEVTQHNSNR